VLAVAIVALIVRPPGPAATPSPSPTAARTGPPVPVATSTAPTDTQVVKEYRWPGPMTSGTYRTAFAWDLGFDFLISVPDAWTAEDIEVMRGDSVSLSVQLVDNLYADPCTAALRTPALGPGLADLAGAVPSAPGVTTATNPTRGERSGFEALEMEYTAVLPDCGGDTPRLWAHRADRIAASGAHGQPWMPVRAGTHRLQIVDVAGTRLVIDAWSAPDATELERSDLDAVAQSLRILAPPPTISEGACTFSIWSPADGRTLDAPYQVTMVGSKFSALGPVPVDENGNELTPGPPAAQLDVRAETLEGPGTSTTAGRPSISYILPLDRLDGGFSTSSTVNGFGGSVIFDGPGTWYVRVDVSGIGCLLQFPVQVLPPAAA
jgi:hypothetical protein